MSCMILHIWFPGCHLPQASKRQLNIHKPASVVGLSKLQLGASHTVCNLSVGLHKHARMASCSKEQMSDACRADHLDPLDLLLNTWPGAAISKQQIAGKAT